MNEDRNEINISPQVFDLWHNAGIALAQPFKTAQIKM